MDYRVRLPPRSLGEFERWVNRYGDGACFLEPVPLAMHHRERAERLLARYADLL